MQAPGSFTPLTTVDYVPTDSDASPVVSRTSLISANGVLAHNVAAVRINWDLSPIPKNNWEGYTEILVGGKPSSGVVPPLVKAIAPNVASDVVGGQLVITATFSNYNTLQWKVNGTNIPGATA